MRCVDWVTVYPSSITLQTGHWYYGAWAEVCPPYADNTDVEWYSNNTYVACVSAANGYIYANNPGTARIYARATDGSGASGYLTVTVRGNIYVSSVELNRTSMSMERGQSSTLTATVCPTNATNPAICWRSTNTAVATVSDGVVTARGTGTAYIYAEAADGNGAYERCLVTVTGDILATSVRVRPASMTLTAGFSDYVHAEVCPEDTTNPNVEWYSSNESVATVNVDSGLVVAQGAGTATITARVTDGSDVRGECLLTVNPPIPVTGIEVCPESLTMNVGEEADLCYNICPSDATNQSVIWCSSNENVATVELRTGKVHAHKAGTTTITATTADGGFAVSCVVDVREKVIVEKDTNSNFSRIVFENGKTWNCINKDTINDYTFNDYTFSKNDPLTHRFYENIYETKWVDPETGDFYYSEPLKQYDAEEIKLIYMIDPLGLAGYVEARAMELFREGNNIQESLDNMLSYKDEIFYLLFNRRPKYYKRNLSGSWNETVDKDNLTTVFSESEFLFGEHVIYDAYTMLEIVSAAIDIASVLTSCPLLSQISDIVAKFQIAKYFLLTYAAPKPALNQAFQEIIQAIADKAYEEVEKEDFAFEGTNKFKNYTLSWAVDLLSFSSDLIALADAFNSGPHFYKEVYTQCINDLKYTIMIRMADNKLVSLAEINKAIQ